MTDLSMLLRLLRWCRVAYTRYWLSHEVQYYDNLLLQLGSDHVSYFKLTNFQLILHSTRFSCHASFLPRPL